MILHMTLLLVSLQLQQCFALHKCIVNIHVCFSKILKNVSVAIFVLVKDHWLSLTAGHIFIWYFHSLILRILIM